MNEFRAALGRGQAARAFSSGAARERCRRRSGASLAGFMIPRAERRHANQRREDRYTGVVERATLHYRHKTILVKVINLSSGGAMIEAPILPRIGEIVALELNGHPAVGACVRWVRAGRVGLDCGEGAFILP